VLAERIGVVLAAGGAPWEVDALQVVSARPSGAVLIKRCVDLPDLLATATTGQARVAVVSAELPGLDVDSVGHLRGAGVTVVLVTGSAPGPGATDLPGVFEVVDASGIDALASVLPAAAAEAAATDSEGGSGAATGPAEAALRPDGAGAVGTPEPAAVDRHGRVVAVWGPTGAPGRTTVAVGVAAELARRGADVLLVDADGYGGAVGQHLGVLDEASGLLGAVRLANAGRLDVARLAACARAVGPRLRVLTGLPRADRWPEVRAVPFDALLDTARRLSACVVLDLGFNLEQSDQAFGSSAPHRNLMTVSGLDHADEILVVGSADPVGLARLARALVELPEVVPAASTRVVVNRVRSSLGWGEKEVRAMVEGFVTPASMHFLPDDPAAADRALVAGRPLVETGDSALRAALSRVVDSLAGYEGDGASRGRRRGRLRRRRAGRGR
jgi:MinD-like ATPase involved in chromosome partitioning or flagellar assembly